MFDTITSSIDPSSLPPIIRKAVLASSPNSDADTSHLPLVIRNAVFGPPNPDGSMPRVATDPNTPPQPTPSASTVPSVIAKAAGVSQVSPDTVRMPSAEPKPPAVPSGGSMDEADSPCK